MTHDVSWLDVRWLAFPVEDLPLPRDSVDTLVVTFSLCTIGDAASALRQARRVLQPGDQMLFCEHGAAPDANLRRWQDRLDGAWARLAGGCHLNRPVAPLIESAGFRLDRVCSAYLPGWPRSTRYITWGVASPARGQD